MKRTHNLMAWSMISLFQINMAYSQNIVDYVDLFICTSGDYGQLDPSATIPFGKVKLGPDTTPSNHSGYDYDADRIKGFSHNRIGGVGCNGAGGNLRILPLIENSDQNDALFDKASERATPAYYSVAFLNKIKAELTANRHTGIHKYTFPAAKRAIIKVDLASSFASLIHAEADVINKREFSATISAKNVCNFGKYTVYQGNRF